MKGINVANLTMRAFEVKIRQTGFVLRFSSLARSAADVMDHSIVLIDSTAPFSIFIRSLS